MRHGAAAYVGIVLALALSAGTRAAAPEGSVPSVVLEVSPREGTVGQALEATLVIRAAAGVEVQRPELGQVGPFTFDVRSWEGPVPDGSAARWTWKGTVAAFEPGTHSLPAIEVHVTGPNGTRTVRSEPVEIEIHSVLAEGKSEAELADLKGPAVMAPDYRPLKLALGIFALLLAASVVGWWLHRRFAHRLAAVPTPEDPFRRIPPHEWVYRELQSLLERRLAEQGEIDLFFAELSRIVKRYLGGRYRVELMERTTTEIGLDLGQAGAPREGCRMTRELLEECDRVKFAGHRPEPGACRAAVEAVYRIVDATRPEPPAAELRRGAA